jgi:hypothetical protein
MTDEERERWHQQCDWESEIAWHQGYTTALRDVAARQIELDQAWERIGQPTHEQRIAERIAEAERCAERITTELDKRRAEYAPTASDQVKRNTHVC